jgi:hypothetical protein
MIRGLLVQFVILRKPKGNRMSRWLREHLAEGVNLGLIIVLSPVLKSSLLLLAKSMLELSSNDVFQAFSGYPSKEYA